MKENNEDKLEMLRKKQEQYNRDMGKQILLDKKLKEEIQEKKKEKLEEIKIDKKHGKILAIVGFVVLIVIIVLAIYLNNPKNFSFKEISNALKTNKVKKESKSEEERYNLALEYLKTREQKFNQYLLGQDKSILKSKKITIPKELSIEAVKEDLEKQKIYIPELDAVFENTIIIGGKSLKIKDFNEINQNEYVKEDQIAQAKEAAHIDNDKPNIIFTRKGIYNNKNQLIVNISNGKAQNFDGLTDNNYNPIVVAYDVKDGDITPKLKITGANFSKLEPNKEYTITYEITNSKGVSVKRDFTFYTIEIKSK